MAGLLVSIRSVEEARLVLTTNIDIIDVKEPTKGSLGATSPSVLAGIACEIPSHRPLSVALGEVLERETNDTSFNLPSNVRYAKLGLSGCAMVPDWPGKWSHQLSLLPPATIRVAVAYADWQRAECPPPEDVTRIGAQFGCRVLLIDTFNKSDGTLLQHLQPSEIEQVQKKARSFGMMFVVAGSLNVAEICTLKTLQPEFFAVRGAVCLGSRTDQIDLRRVNQIARCLREPNFQVAAEY